VTALAGEGDPPTALFTFFTEMVAQAAVKKTVIDLQARTGTKIQVTQSAEGLGLIAAIGEWLRPLTS